VQGMTHFALIFQQAYAKEVDVHKRTLLLVNKADLLPASVRFGYCFYFSLFEIIAFEFPSL
jgi:hypothetical protein